MAKTSRVQQFGEWYIHQFLLHSLDPDRPIERWYCCGVCKAPEARCVSLASVTLADARVLWRPAAGMSATRFRAGLRAPTDGFEGCESA